MFSKKKTFGANLATQSKQTTANIPQESKKRFQFDMNADPWNGYIYRMFLDNGKWFVLELTSVPIILNPGDKTCTVKFKDPDYLDIIDKVETEFLKIWGPQRLCDIVDDYFVLECKATQGTKVFDSSGAESTIFAFPLRVEAIANVEIVFYALDFEGKHRHKPVLIPRVSKIYILALETERSKPQGELPSYDFFKFHINKEGRKAYYPKGYICNDEENRRVGFVLVEVQEKGKKIVNTALYKELKMTGFIHPREMQGKSDNTITDYDEVSYHYGIVMTYSDRKFIHVLDDKEAIRKRFMQKARGYLESLEISVRGFWFDEGEDRRAHCNLHVVSILPLAYFQVLFDTWMNEMGIVTIKKIWEPIGWRIYASRNHLMFTTKDRYTPSVFVYHKMIEMLDDALPTELWSTMPTEIVIKIMDYVMYPHGHEEMKKDIEKTKDEEFMRIFKEFGI